MKIEHLIDNTYQVVDSDTNSVVFQGTHEACAYFLMDYNSPTEQPTMDEINARLDKLEQEVEWTREMIDILEEHIENMNNENSAHW